jgi:hypothetical protein
LSKFIRIDASCAETARSGSFCRNDYISPAASQLGVAIFKWQEGADLAARARWGDTSIVRTGEDSNIPRAEGTFTVPLPDDLNEFAQQFDAGNFSEYDARK